jgi:cytochrome c oxidase subunit 1
VSVASLSVLHPRASAPPAGESGGDRTVGGLFALTGIALFAVMGVLGLVMRLTQADVIGLSPAWFYRLMTLHGAGMLMGALLAMMGALWFVLRADVELSVPRMLASYASILLGAVVVVVAVLGGGFAAGWTFLWPLPYSSVGQWSTWATVVFLVGILLVGAGFFIFCVDVLEQVTRTYGGLSRTLGLVFLRGRDPDPPPPQAIGATVVSIAGVVASAVGTTMVMALLVRSYDTGMRIDALWAKNLTYFFGHTLANLIIYLAAGAVYVLVPRYTGRPWRTTVPLVVGWLATLFLVLTVYSHHLYMDMVQPRALEYISSAGSFASAIPVAVVTIFTGMMLVWGSGYRWTLASRLLYLGFAGWAIGGVGAVIDSVLPVNARFHNTLWVPGHFHTYLLVGVMFWVFAFVAHLLERAAEQPAAPLASRLAPGLMVVGGYGLVALWFISGALGIPRRYAVHPPGTSGYSLAASVFAMIFAVGFLVLLAEFGRLGAIALERRRERVREEGRPGEDGDAMERWTTFRRRLARPPSAAAPTIVAAAAGRRATVSGGPGLVAELDAPLATAAQFAAAAAAAVVALASFAPAVADATEGNPRFHHLAHAGQFALGALVGLTLASLPGVFDRLGFRGSDDLALVLVIAAPAGMLLAMAPRVYVPLEDHPALHALYHVGIAFLGFLTGLGCARLGRVAGRLVLITSVGMAVLFAPGISGV